MLKKTACVVAMTLFAFGLTACDVHQTKEGHVTAPKYQVEKTQEGSAKVPSYDVKTPEVTVKTEERNVDVPTVKKEERTVTVPDVDVKSANQK